MRFETTGVPHNRHPNMIEDSQNTHPEMRTKLKGIEESSNWGARRTQESQTNKLTGVTRRFWVSKNTGTKGKIKRKLPRQLGLPIIERKRKIGMQI